jgi:ABC-type oligopeptide transport system ATPase subunit
MLTLEQISVDFKVGKRWQRAVDDVSLELLDGEILGIVGESGSGKSTLARVMMGLQKPVMGKAYWQGKDYADFDAQQWRQFRQQVQLIFQDPLDALNPRMTLAELIAEPLKNIGVVASERDVQVKTLLDAVGLSTRFMDRYPHEFSGGQCQRIGIARAMILQPKLLICDEPVSALDVSIQAQIVNLLLELKEKMGISLVFISHDLSIVRHLCDRVLVLKQGKVVETGDTDAIFTAPQHIYTQKLLGAIPYINPDLEYKRVRMT